MAFSKKTWQDRVSEQPQRRLLTPTDGGAAMTVDVTRQEGIVVQEGDAFSAANMNDLESRIKNTFDADEATLATVNNKANTNASNIATLQTNVTSVSNRVTTNTNNINSLNTKMSVVENELTANSKRIYMDYKNGKYGINTSANRGADTFIPFNGSFVPRGKVLYYSPSAEAGIMYLNNVPALNTNWTETAYRRGIYCNPKDWKTIYTRWHKIVGYKISDGSFTTIADVAQDQWQTITIPDNIYDAIIISAYEADNKEIQRQAQW